MHLEYPIELSPICTRCIVRGMARRIVHQLVDDIDGTELDEGEGETVHFSLNGTAYEIDLTSEHADELRSALAPYIESGRKVTSSAARSTSSRGTSVRKRPARNPEVAAIRAWARDNGHELSERGRIPQPIVDAYNDAH
ncbi:Lsr2 family protein [Microbacterium sp. WCS2018Hpa-23]|uniref:histone-like nucleoid-structuring protein Lsr2 n=2 Tax=unclassified Microbacterium TaxID=2609290 RepID=UPI002882F19D|nr:Lsr2 family protein [Microbacterium sp. WCS2018Hpa-23]